MIHRWNIPGSYAILFFTASGFTSITTHIHNQVSFSFWLSLFIPSGAISPLFSSSILGTYRLRELIFQCPIILPFHTLHGVLKARMLKWFFHFLLQWTTFCQNSPPWPIHFGWPYMAWFIVSLLDKAVLHVISLVSFLWLWFSFLSALWWIRIRGLWKLPDGRDWVRGKLGLVLMSGAMLSKSLIQFSVDG